VQKITDKRTRSLFIVDDERKKLKVVLKREKFSHINLLNELKLDPGDWFNYLKMDEHTYLNSSICFHFSHFIKCKLFDYDIFVY